MACITFGAPLVGDKALRKLVLDSGWDKRIHQVVWRHDMVPRILLSPGTCALQLLFQGGWAERGSDTEIGHTGRCHFCIRVPNTGSQGVKAEYKVIIF